MRVFINFNSISVLNLKLTSSFICFFLCSLFTISSGQSNEISLKSGVLLSGNIAFYEGILDIRNSPSFGIEYAKKLSEHSSLNAEYTWASNASTFFRAYGNSSTNNFRSNLQSHYFQISHVRTYMLSRVSPYTIAGIGLAYFNLENRGDKTLLGFNLGGGAKVKINQNVNLKLQGRFLLPLLFEGGGFFIDIFNPSNSGFSLYSTIPLLQGEFSLALSYNF